LVNYAPYVSGEVNTVHSFSQTYGYFEMRAELPKGQGFWPAFWLMPTDGSWPPELDAMEVLGSNTTALVTSVHSAATGAHTTTNLFTTIPDASAGFHTYGVDWEPDHITWYFDGQKVFQTATPADLNKPMYMIANLAVGGYWPGNADGTSSAQMQIDYIRAYASGAGNVPDPGSAAQTPSVAHGAHAQVVYELYQAAYGRAPDAGGFSFWTGAADAGVSVKALADSFIAAPEFTQIYGSNPSNATYVAELYSHVLGRAPDAGGLAYWVSEADTGMARDSLLVAFATSAENVQLIGSHASDMLATL
jgi:beta-glucanase (GH16 family)